MLLNSKINKKRILIIGRSYIGEFGNKESGKLLLGIYLMTKKVHIVSKDIVGLKTKLLVSQFIINL